MHVIAKYPYTASKTDEIDLEVNMNILLVKVEVGGWWKVIEYY